jgi:nitroreductase
MSSNPATVSQALHWRYATKKFAPRAIPDATWEMLRESLALTPSSYNLQPWKLIVVENSAVRAQLQTHSWNQGQITGASHLVVFARRTEITEADVDRLTQQITSVRGTPPEKLAAYRQMMISGIVRGKGAQAQKDWASCQLYIALGQLMAVAAVLAIDTCPLEGIDPAKYDEVLDLKATGYETVVACALGYRSADDHYALAKKVRFATDEVVTQV